jgi:general secretion pathway protein I
MKHKPLIQRCKHFGFTLLEVMVAMAIIAIALTAVLGSQSQSVSLASEAKFSTTAPLLAQSKMAQIEVVELKDLNDDSGDFGDDFPGYTWQLSVKNVLFEEPVNVAEQLRQIDLKISWSEGGLYQYTIRLYRFFPKPD